MSCPGEPCPFLGATHCPQSRVWQEVWGGWGAPILSQPQLPEMLALSLVQVDKFPFHALPKSKKGTGSRHSGCAWIVCNQSLDSGDGLACVTRAHVPMWSRSPAPVEMPAPCCPRLLSVPAVQRLELLWVAARVTFPKVPLCCVCPCQAQLCSSRTAAGDAASAVTPLPTAHPPSLPDCLSHPPSLPSIVLGSKELL